MTSPGEAEDEDENAETEPVSELMPIRAGKAYISSLKSREEPKRAKGRGQKLCGTAPSLQPDGEIIADSRIPRRTLSSSSNELDTALGVEVVRETAKQQPWHIVVPGEACSEVPPDTEMIVVLVNLSELEAAVNVINALALAAEEEAEAMMGDLKSREEGGLVIVAMLLRSDDSPIADRPKAREAFRECLLAGADDVLLQPKGFSEIFFQLCTGLVAARDQKIAALRTRKLEESRLQDHTNKWTLNLERLRNRSNKIFYTMVQYIWKDLPNIQYEVVLNLNVGQKYWNCILDRELGQGQFGIVFRVSSERTGRVEAIKFISKDTLRSVTHIDQLCKEVCNHRRLTHANVVRFIDVSQIRNYFCIRMEYAGSRNLQYLLLKAKGAPLPLKDVRSYSAQMYSALGYCHSMDVGHRDVHPGNLVVSHDGAVFLVDFGDSEALSYADHAEPSAGIHGTMPYIAPEVFWDDSYDITPADVWSAGIVMLDMLVGLGQWCSWVGWSEDTPATAERYWEIRDRFDQEQGSLEKLLKDVNCAEAVIAINAAMSYVAPERWSCRKLLQSSFLKGQDAQRQR